MCLRFHRTRLTSLHDGTFFLKKPQGLPRGKLTFYMNNMAKKGHIQASDFSDQINTGVYAEENEDDDDEPKLEMNTSDPNTIEILGDIRQEDVELDDDES